ncbi:hypothetical protein GCM10011419_25920 [Vogesella fluminis]|uniref:Uncharacterized protein n=1 Tax=Vogesella fluminis TaxID=1069161 RepID=A0ABQ3HFZ2_9NEIS|nr:hypothetical protein GCM10011419_25920 [Vogesella fluminis]
MPRWIATVSGIAGYWLYGPVCQGFALSHGVPPDHDPAGFFCLAANVGRNGVSVPVSAQISAHIRSRL